MILYFADRHLNILGHASTELPKGITISYDKREEDVETGVASFELDLSFSKETRSKVESWANVGNYILRNDEGETELYTIVESEMNTKKQSVYIYSEDDGLDLLNEVFGEYEADKAYPITHYINMFAAESGFEIGINEISSLKKKLAWDNEATGSARIADVATQFDGAEVSYSFKVDGLYVVRKYINIYQKRGNDKGVTLRLNRDIDEIVSSKKITNLATALQCEGGSTPQTVTVLEKAKSGGNPAVLYTVELKTKGRTKNTAQITATVTAALTSESAKLADSYGLTASIYMGGSWHNATIKATDKENKKEWKGTTNHSTEFTFSLSNVNAGEAIYSDIKFKTTSNSGSAGVLASTNCGQFVIPNYIEGGENGEDINSRRITLEGRTYDDGDFFIDSNGMLKSRNAHKTWSRLILKDGKAQQEGGYITKQFYYDTPSQAELLEKSIAELKKLREMEVNFTIEIQKLPDNVKIGDRINVVDDDGALYLSTRILKLEKSVTDNEQRVTLGEHLLKNSGISQKVADLAAQFAKEATTAKKALSVANNAKSAANTAQQSANDALEQTVNALTAAENANTAAQQAAQSANDAQTAANNAQTAVGNVQEQVSGMETSIANAQQAAAQAQQAAQTAETKADEAHTAAENAQSAANQAYNNAVNVQKNLKVVQSTAENAQSAANQAISDAEEAATTAAAAKLDAEKAKEEIDALGEGLTTLSNTMTAEYARKTDLTEAEASLKSQITQNAAQIRSTVSKVEMIDETANNAAAQAAAAYLGAEEAQRQATEAQTLAEEIQALADEAQALADEAQTEADIAKAAANTAQAVLDQANAELQAAQADLETVMSRADATAEEIEQAQQAVNTAQAAANTAQANAEAAIEEAEAAQAEADTAAENALNAQAEAIKARNNATIAQKAAEQAKGSLASQAQETANTAKQTALKAQETASTAVSNAQEAQNKADAAAQTAATAQQAADKAKADATAAQSELNTAKQNLEAVTSRVGATEAEIAAAQQAVNTAQQAADKAKTDAAAAQSAADKAKADALTAQNNATAAQNAADAAQTAADAAKSAADAAQAAVDALAVRVTKAETDIVQTNEQIKLLATKEEVTTTLGGYYTKAETDSAISVKSNEINLSVDSKISNIEIGGRNLLLDTKDERTMTRVDSNTWLVYEISEVLLELGNESLILSFDARTEEGITDLNLDMYLRDEAGTAITAWRSNNLTAEYTHYSRDLVFKEGYSAADTLRCQLRLNAGLGTAYVKNVKLEKGNKPTDWTPAPEDVDEAILDSSDQIREEITEVKSQVLIETEGITLEHLKKYVSNEQFEADLEAYVGSQLKILEDRLTAKVSGVEDKTNSVDSDLQDKYNLITKYFDFTINGLEIKSVHTDENGNEVESPYKIVIDNDNQTTYANGKKVQIIDAVTGEVLTPKLKVTDSFDLLGYRISKDEATGNVNWEYIGG